MEGEGREGKGREGKGREIKTPPPKWAAYGPDRYRSQSVSQSVSQLVFLVS